MMQPCLIHFACHLVGAGGSVRRGSTKEMMQPCLIHLACHLFGAVGQARQHQRDDATQSDSPVCHLFGAVGQARRLRICRIWSGLSRRCAGRAGRCRRHCHRAAPPSFPVHGGRSFLLLLRRSSGSTRNDPFSFYESSLRRRPRPIRRCHRRRRRCRLRRRRVGLLSRPGL